MNQKQLESEIRALLNQFGQVILHGPPGTGKTYAARRVAATLLHGDPDAKVDGDPRFALVQFHPSYNYEDFVRGVQVKTDDGQVVYETVNRVFGQMAEKAASASDKAFAMVIDEINRANVSAVLGELIYALEYRGRPVKTPYAIGSGDNAADLSVPANLKIIGTMNAADRTIGQIDYAVRRRFAFVHCAPDRSVIKNPTAGKFFDDVARLFVPDNGFISPDYDRKDVEIGHSYFLADGGKLANKIIYQVVPILREYVKDGVLTKDAEAVIDKIEQKEKETIGRIARNRAAEKIFVCLGMPRGLHGGHTPRESALRPLPRLFRVLVNNYAIIKDVRSIEELQLAFPDTINPDYGVVRDMEDTRKQLEDPGFHYFMEKGEEIRLRDGSTACVCSHWEQNSIEKFCLQAKHNHYHLLHEMSGDFLPKNNKPHWHVNVGKDGKTARSRWKHCHEHGFLAGTRRGPGSHGINHVPVGAIVFAYIAGQGYVGVGEVTMAAESTVKGFDPEGTDAVSPGLWQKSRLFGRHEYAIGVKWWNTFPQDRKSAVKVKKMGEKGITALQITDHEKLRKLIGGFDCGTLTSDAHDANYYRGRTSAD